MKRESHVDGHPRASDLLDIWWRQLEDGTQAWARMISGAPMLPILDPLGFWRPVMDQAVTVWAQILSQLPVSPELVTQWKQFVDQSVEAWARALGHVMGTEAFAQAFGQSLDLMLTAQAPVRKVGAQAMETALSALEMPSRNQVTGVARQLVDLEDRVERLEDSVRMVLERLETRSANGRKNDRRTP
jgi:Poly(R)-hydroxyalkanoic acid synthase subunit (PHA_synth_III_E)